MLAQAPGDAGDVYRPLLQSDVGRALQGSDDLLFHDYLADISQPFFFSQFMGAATAAGLQFASEAVFHSMSVQALPAEVATMLGDLAERDIIAKEQYLDFVTCRAFRQTVLCHEEVQLRPDVDRERLEQFRFFSEAVRQEPEPGRDGVSFRHRNGSALRTDHPLALAAFDRLLAAQPRSVPFADLATDVGATTVEDRELLASVLFEAFSVGVIGMRLVEPQIVLELSERPTASAWARHLAPTGQATNLYHEVVELDDPARRLLPLADGSRPLTRLARDAGLEEADAVATLRRLATLGLLVG
jgi:methyltransferase-like protein